MGYNVFWDGNSLFDETRKFRNVVKFAINLTVKQFLNVRRNIRRYLECRRRGRYNAPLRAPEQYPWMPNINVFQNSFIGILHITKHRIRKVTEVFKKTGGIVNEKRGRNRVSSKNKEKLMAVKGFIESFKCIESHSFLITEANTKYNIGF
jgi:hypothetical protein